MMNQFNNVVNPNPQAGIAPIPQGTTTPGIMQQPGPKMDANAPLGDISFLANHSRFVLKQRFEMLETLAAVVGFSGVETANKYDVYDADTGAPLLFVAEQSECCNRTFCNPHHKADLHVFDVRNGGGSPLFTAHKPLKCNCCILLTCCAQSQTTLRDGQSLGSSRQYCPLGGCFTPMMAITDENNQEEYTLKGPCCIIGGTVAESCVDFEFKILDQSKQPVGRIVHMKPGNMMETVAQLFGDSDNYLMEIPEGVSAEKTANLISTMVLLDYLFFEGNDTEGGCTLCISYCGGCICPCSSSGEDGGGGRRRGGGGLAGAALMGGMMMGQQQQMQPAYGQPGYGQPGMMQPNMVQGGGMMMPGQAVAYQTNAGSTPVPVAGAVGVPPSPVNGAVNEVTVTPVKDEV